MEIIQYHANHNERYGRLPIINQWIGLREKITGTSIFHWKIYGIGISGHNCNQWDILTVLPTYVT